MADLNWSSRLVVKYTENNVTHEISPIDSFTPSFALNAEPIHSIERTHVGVIYSPKSITFSLTVKAIGDTVARLTSLALRGVRFEIALLEKEGSDWGLSSVVMSDCVITSCTPSSTTPSGPPTATFSGFSLASKVTPKGIDAVEVPK